MFFIDQEVNPNYVERHVELEQDLPVATSI